MIKVERPTAQLTDIAARSILKFVTGRLVLSQEFASPKGLVRRVQRLGPEHFKMCWLENT